jgi:alpha-ribazole phosphatase
MKLWLIRHPQPVIEPGICYGALDILAEPSDLERVVGQMKALSTPDIVVCSPLQRAYALATALHEAGWPAPQIDQDLQEMNFGAWEGIAWDAIGKAAIDAWAADMLHYVPPGGESVAQLGQRALRGVHRAIARAQGEGRRDATIAIVAHAGVLQTVPALLRGEPIPVGRMPRLGYGARIEIVLP